MRALGIDIGTTSICMVLYDKDKNTLLLNRSVPNEFSGNGNFQQDADGIVDKVKGLLKEVGENTFDAVGISGQMHGIVYVDEKGKSVSPFYTWKEESGRQKYCQEENFEEYLSRRTGYPMYSGYGSVTHYYLRETGGISSKAVSFTDIGDYLAMHLTGSVKTAVNESMGASFGGYDLVAGDFDRKALQSAGVDTLLYPEICTWHKAVGMWKGKPVFSAIGDNQASYIGAVKEAETAMGINVGTGAQISAYFPELCPEYGHDTDIRPFPGGGYLYVGASLNGGKVYEKLAAFFGEVCEQFTGIRVNAYEKMAEIAEQKKNTDLRAFPNLYGIRGSAEKRSGLKGLTEENFHPADLIRSYVHGMAEELRSLYERFPDKVKKGRTKLTASGNGLRKNHLLCEEVEKVFGMPVVFSEFREEAAAGAAEFACRMYRG